MKIRRWWVGVLALAALAGESGVVASPPARFLPPARVLTDSFGYEYGTPMLADGVRDPIRWQEAWLSDERGAGHSHWVELAFTSDVPVRTAAIFWGVENGAPASSRAYAIQAWVHGAFTNILEVRDNPPAARSIHTFEATTSRRFRVCQPAGGGSAQRPDGMWIAEIELYDGVKPDAAFGTPEDLADAKHRREEMRDRTIGVFRRSRYYRGRTGAIANPLMRRGWRVIPLDYLDERELGLCRVVILCGTRAIPNANVLDEYVRNGGGLLAAHDSCGRGPGSVLPDVWTFDCMGTAGGFAVTGAKHPITAGVTNPIESTYGDYAVMKAGRKGTALVRDADGRAVVVAGRYGDGRAVAIGTFPGLSSGTNWNASKMVEPGAGELALLTNAVRWLAQDTGWRIPGRRLFRGRAKAPEKTLFENVTDACGMTYGGYSKNVSMADVNGDGWLDIFATQCKIATADPCFNQLYRNDGNWRFTEIAGPAGVTLPHGIGAAFGDADNDGNLDLFVSWMPEMAGTRGVGTLFVGDGACGFRDVGAAAGFASIGQVAGCQWADIDLDGDLDLYVAGFEQENRLYRNRGNGTFEEVSAAMGLGDLGARGVKGYGGNMAFVLSDLEGDGFDDLMAFNTNVLHVFRNDRGKGFTDVPDYMGEGRPRLAGWSWGLTLGDYDNDGDLDAYVAGRNALLRNEGHFRFSEVTAGSGLDRLERNIGQYGALFADWNNDGRLDLFLATGGFDSFTFENAGGGAFRDVSGAIGLDAFGVHGFNFGDLDNDGDLDFFATSWAKFPSVLLRNRQDDGNALAIRARGRQTNRSGVGAKVWVYEEPDGANGTRRLQGYREVASGGGIHFAGASLRQHVAVARGRRYTVEVLFPVSGKRARVTGATAGQFLTIDEPDPPVNVVEP